jgi:hypothetical protein
MISRVADLVLHSVGKFVVATLQHPEESFGKALKVQSFVVSPKEVLAEYEKQTGVKWSTSSISLDELKQLEAKAWADGSPVATMYTLRRIWAEGGTLYEKNDNELLGMNEKDLDSLESTIKLELAGGVKVDEL